jgi:DNA-binding NtrC family response regulator
LSSLRDVALELLNAVESLKGVNPNNGSHSLNLQEEVRRFETDLIQAALVRTGGNQLRAARLLGVKHTTLNAKIKRYRISTRPFAAQNGEQEIAA